MDEDRQLALYQIGVQNMWNDVCNVELVWHYVAFDKEIRSKRTEEGLDELKKAIEEEKWDSDILDEIKKFLEIETVKSVRLSKSKRED